MEGWNGKGAHEVPAVTFKKSWFCKSLLYLHGVWGISKS